MTKSPAGRNKTITILPEEVDALGRMICSTDDLRDGFREDMIINADLLSCIDHIPDAAFDLIVIDPPYNLYRNFAGKVFSSRSDAEYEEYLRSWFPKVCQKLKADGTLYMCGDWRCTSAMQRVISEHLTIINRITWQREKGRGASANWKNGMEDIWMAVRDPQNYHFDLDAVMMKRRVRAPYREDGKPKDWQDSEDGKFRLTHPSNFWDDISVPFWSMPENTDHPTQKPEKLLAKLILASSAPGDIVFDPFLGSGTTAVTACKLGRHYCGVEISRDYCLLTAKRLQRAATDTTIQGYSDGVFWERNTFLQQKKSKE